MLRKLRKRYVCPWVHKGAACGDEYANCFSPNALNYFHKHLKLICCTAKAQEKLLTYARDKGIMKYLKKKGLVAGEIVAT